MYNNTKDKDINNSNKNNEFQVDCSNLEIGCAPCCLSGCLFDNNWLNMFSFSSRRSNLEVKEQLSMELNLDPVNNKLNTSSTNSTTATTNTIAANNNRNIITP